MLNEMFEQPGLSIQLEVENNIAYSWSRDYETVALFSRIGDFAETSGISAIEISKEMLVRGFSRESLTEMKLLWALDGEVLSSPAVRNAALNLERHRLFVASMQEKAESRGFKLDEGRFSHIVEELHDELLKATLKCPVMQTRIQVAREITDTI